MADLGQLIYNWAFAIYDAARDSNKLNDITNEAADIVRALKVNKEYLNVLNSYDIENKVKYEFIDQAFGSYNPLIVNAIKLASKQHTVKYITMILNKFVELSNEKLNIKYGTIFTTSPISSQEIKKFEDKLSSDLHAEVHLVNQIMPDLIAGVRIKVEDYLIDNSIEGQLNKIKKSIN
ncbi:F0F1 ATP synthase subunit delta [Metamycoplasma neophronis]|uniref:ATP synthase subunit delta n=1 Tax=Metamycoplasma neophronis TaxID=872983 RepID=A0ABY2Z199_9BACT|nr:F0F1 ATP synthase subunit delta [Metamycoplasma neophronis]TPR54327.1 F0F1 ATP synthase subunit delta [Metamycoplasma neophronis]